MNRPVDRLQPFVECAFGLDGGAMFGIVPRPLWSRTNPADERNRIELATRCLFLEVGDRRVIVDAGMGERWRDKERDIYAVRRPDGGLRGQLAEHGVDPDSITDVVMTHLHFDHAGGLAGRDDDGGLQPTFPNATHHVQRENWLWAHAPSPRDAGSYRREDFGFFGDADAPPLHLLDGVTTLFDAIEVLPLQGHTPGMQALRFRVGEQTLVYLADLIPTRGHVPVPYVMGYDVQPLKTVREKAELLEQAVRHDWVLAFEHDPEHAFARVERDERGRYRVAASSNTLTDLR